MEDSPSVGVDMTGLIAVEVDSAGVAGPDCLVRLRMLSKNGSAGKANEGEYGKAEAGGDSGWDEGSFE